MEFENGPYVQLAAFCENVLDEKDEVKSLIRVVDHLTKEWTGPGTEFPEPQEGDFSLAYVLLLKSGDAEGTYPLSMKWLIPNGEQRDVLETIAHFHGGEHGVALVVRMNIGAEQGLHWLVSYLDGHQIAKSPLRVSRVLRSTGPDPNPSTSEPQSQT